MSLPKISIIIAAYNGELTIEQCLDNIVKVDYPPEKLEVIIIDDGSTDSTYNILEAFAEKEKIPKIKILHQENLGHARAINAGMNIATGEVVISLSQDVYVSSDFVKLLSGAFSDPKVGLAQGPLLRIDKTLNDPLFHCTTQLTPGLPYISAAIAYRAKAMDAVGRCFNPALSITGDDTDFALRILKNGYTYQWVPQAKAYHDLVPRKKKSLTKFLNTSPSSLGLLVKLHPEMRNSMVLKVFWRGLFAGRISSVGIILVVPLVFWLFGAGWAMVSVLVWFSGFLFYSWFISYRSVRYNKQILIYLPIVAFFNILSLQVAFLKLLVFSIKNKTLIL